MPQEDKTAWLDFVCVYRVVLADAGTCFYRCPTAQDAIAQAEREHPGDMAVRWDLASVEETIDSRAAKGDK